MKRIAALLLVLCITFVSSCSRVEDEKITDFSDTASVTTQEATELEVVVSIAEPSQTQSNDALSIVESSDVSVPQTEVISGMVSEEASSDNSSEIADSSSSQTAENESEVTEGRDLTEYIITSGKEIDPSKPMVCLTFDDGPSNRGTPSILDVLEKYGVVATFFDVGYNVEANPEIVKREVALGCEVASHTYSHTDLNKLSSSQLIAEIDKANSTFESVIGYTPLLLRPPYGRCTKEVAAQIDQAVIFWSIDTLDWKTLDPQKIFDSIKAEESLDGKCILMHSIYEETAQALELIIPYLLSEGYQIVTVSEMIVNGNGDRLIAGKRYGYSYFR